MGLDTTHGAWHGAYSSYSRWRARIGVLGGFKLRDGSSYEFDLWDDFTVANAMGEWETSPEDPLIILLAHSDCDGWIEPEHCYWIAERLERLLPGLDEVGDDGGHIGNWREKTESFIAGLRAAHAAGERLEYM